MTYFDDTRTDDKAITDTAHHAEGQMVLILDEDGLIQACSDNCESVVGYTRDELLKQHVSTLVLQLAAVPLFVDGEVNPLVSFLGHCDVPFLIHHRRGRTFSSRLSFVQLHHLPRPAARILIAPQQSTRTDAASLPGTVA